MDQLKIPNPPIYEDILFEYRILRKESPYKPFIDITKEKYKKSAPAYRSHIKKI